MCRATSTRSKLMTFDSLKSEEKPQYNNFLRNLLSYLTNFGNEESYTVLNKMRVWVSFFVSVDGKRRFTLPLYILEEDIKDSKQKFCQHCVSQGKFFVGFELIRSSD